MNVTSTSTRKVTAIVVTAIASPALALGLALGMNINSESTYQEGADSGAHDLCQELGGTPGEGLEFGTCTMPPPEVITKTKVVTKVKKVEVPGPVQVREVKVEVPAETLQCPTGFVAWDQRRGGGEWAYCEAGSRP